MRILSSIAPQTRYSSVFRWITGSSVRYFSVPPSVHPDEVLWEFTHAERMPCLISFRQRLSNCLQHRSCPRLFEGTAAAQEQAAHVDVSNGVRVTNVHGPLLSVKIEQLQ